MRFDLGGKYIFKALNNGSIVRATVTETRGYKVILEYTDGTSPYEYVVLPTELQNEIMENDWIKEKDKIAVLKSLDWPVANPAFEHSESVSVLEPPPVGVDTGRTPESKPKPERGLLEEFVPPRKVPTKVTFNGRDLPYIPDNEEWVRFPTKKTNPAGEVVVANWHELRCIKSQSRGWDEYDVWTVAIFWCGSFKHMEFRKSVDFIDVWQFSGRPWEFEEGRVCKMCWRQKGMHSLVARANTRGLADI